MRTGRDYVDADMATFITRLETETDRVTLRDSDQEPMDRALLALQPGDWDRVWRGAPVSLAWPPADRWSAMREELAAGASTLTDAQREQLTAMMTRFLPDAPLTWMIGLGADAVAAELAGEMIGGAGTVAA